MKTLVITCAIILCSGSVAMAQATTAMDWTKTDCRNSQAHNLFSILDSGYVVIQEYVMMNCGSCVTAGNGLKGILQSINPLDLDKIKIFQTAYDGTTDCNTMEKWATTNGFSASTLFSQGASEVSYYGGFGMPTIVVMGGVAQHKVYYQKRGYAASQNAPIKEAIMTALQESSQPSGVTEDLNSKEFTVVPNPVESSFALYSEQSIEKVSIIELSGKLALEKSYLGGTRNPVLDLSNLSNGAYFIRITNVDGISFYQRIVKQ